MLALLPLVGFSFVSSVTPGPNNVLLWASGATFGFRLTMRHVVGTGLGIGAMALVAAAGLGAVLVAASQLAFAMKVAATGYLLYLAYQVAGAHDLERATIAHPLGVVQAAAFQLVNPKAWVFVLGAIVAFRPSYGASPEGGVLAAATMAVAVIPASALWASTGGVLSGLISGERSRRVVSAALAILLLATLAETWA